MTKFRLLLLLAGLVYTMACSDLKSKKPENTSEIPKFSLDEFNTLPSELDGCGCYFSETEEKFKNKQYVFAADFEATCFITIDKTPLKLKIISATRKSETDGLSHHIDVYSSGNYKATINIKFKNSNGDETWWNEGTLTVEAKDGKKVVKTIVGECGC